ncbi:efflux RND transporter periplasmic adaptor subunit [Mucilaginibacter sp. BJC16-A38]|uniref:efflux RND transporter periplasmic adaptor subunit n=1 Tax=Mucilaginibacter phenanthrenivorans TaxID=1234842 RepID=UPI0021579B7C|nr:efflux RND transporter periplasmic adaptor subunit [Mucilaginibacter phenanthrenivorans]MCR8557807.1 efflux RND transporter periplasmic adaptor subunit [Mucilaginibacter phenanthrenivorans]
MKYLTYRVYINVLLIAGTLLASCSGGSEKAGKKEKDTTKTENKESGLELSAEQMRSVGIVTGPIEQKNLDAVVRANGQLAVPPQNKADVSILSGGIISNIDVLEGQQVHKGQVLATIKNQDLIKLQQDYLAAKNNFTYVQAEYDRQSQLKAAGAGTGKSFQASEATYNAEHSRLTAYESQLQQLGVSPGRISNGHIVSQFPVTSPISGTVGSITANIGAYVQPGTSIMEVVDNSKIHCDLTVFEKDLMLVKVGQKVSFQLTNQDNEIITGVINGVNKSFENESKGVIVHAVINNKQHQNLIPGMYVTALISTGSKLTAAVPVDAVIRSEGKQYIFVSSMHNKNGKTIFTKMEVTTGVSELGYIQVTPLTALPTNVQIATKGAFYLQSKAAGGAGEE